MGHASVREILKEEEGEVTSIKIDATKFLGEC